MKNYMLIVGMILASMMACTKAVIIETDPTDPDGPISYTNHIQTIMLNNCVTCHSGALPAAGLDLTNYQNVRSASESGNLLHRVEDGVNPMPPAGLISSDLRSQIAQWAQEGFPEN